MLATIGGSGHCGTPELWSKLVQAPMVVGGTNGGAQGVVYTNCHRHLSSSSFARQQASLIVRIPETVTQGQWRFAPHSVVN